MIRGSKPADWQARSRITESGHVEVAEPTIQDSSLRSSMRTRRRAASGWPAGSTTYIGSSISRVRSIASSWQVSKPVSISIAMSASPAFSAAIPSSGSPGTSVSSTPGWRARNCAIARGASVAPAVGNATIRSRPPRRPAIASSSASASARRASTASAWRTSASPASVSFTPRALRSTRTVPASRSSVAICCETADCV